VRDLRRLSGKKIKVGGIQEALRLVRGKYPHATMDGSLASYSFMVGEKMVAEAWTHRTEPAWWLRTLEE
jgi:hypothetical protein